MAELSIHEQKLEEIALAIQEKEGSSAPIVADDFAARIRAIKTDNLPTGIYKIEVLSNDTLLGTVTGSGYASEGMIATATATPNQKSAFNGWRENSEIISLNDTFSFSVVKDRRLIANFQEITFQNIWKSSTLPSAKAWEKVVYGANKFVAFSSGNGSYSEDGIIWTEFTMPSSCMDAVYTNGEFVGVSFSKCIRSTDGINWTLTDMPKLPSGSYGNFRSITCGNGLLVSLSYGSNSVAYSRDGINWSLSTMPYSGDWLYITYGKGIFIASGNSPKIAYSTDAVTWELTDTVGSIQIGSLAYGDGKFVALDGYSAGAGNKYSYYSENGIEWARTTICSDYKKWGPVAYGAGRFVALTTGGDSYSAYSEDGITWHELTLPVKAYWSSVCYGDGKFVAVTSRYNNANSNRSAYLT